MSDLISRQDALKTYQNIVCKGICCADCRAVDRDGNCAVEDWLKSLQSAQQWIPCSERLPEFKQKIFFTEKNNETGELYVGRGMFCGVIARTGSGSNPWNYADTFSVSERRWHVLDSKIVAWFPVPLPWKGEADG